MNQPQVQIDSDVCVNSMDFLSLILATNSSNAPFNDESLYGTFGGNDFSKG